MLGKTMVFFSLNRILIIGTLLGGLIFLGLSSQQSWLEVPIASQGSAAGLPYIAAAEPWVTHIYQGGAVLTIVLLIASWILYQQWSRLGVSVACVWLIAVFAFPYFLMLHDPLIAAKATWLHTQHYKLIWQGGDIITSYEFNALDWKAHVYIVDAPQQVSVLKMPSWSPLEVGFDRLPQLTEWLGYSNAFCQFARKGWFLAFAGGGMMLVATFFRQGSVDFGLVGYAFALLATLGTLFCVTAWSVPFLASGSLSEASRHTVNGRYELALEKLKQAGRKLPVIQEDTYFVAQRALLEHHLEIDSLYAKIYQANLLEREAFYQQALWDYREVIALSPVGSALRREASRALLRYAVHSMNSGDNIQAIEQLEEMLTIEPCNLKAIYMLQIAYIRSGNTKELYDLVNHQYEVYSYLRFPTKVIVLEAAQKHAAYAAMLDHDVGETWRRWIKTKSP